MTLAKSRRSDILNPYNQCSAIIDDARRVSKGWGARFSVFEHILLLERRIGDLEDAAQARGRSA